MVVQRVGRALSTSDGDTQQQVGYKACARPDIIRRLGLIPALNAAIGGRNEAASRRAADTTTAPHFCAKAPVVSVPCSAAALIHRRAAL